MLVLTSMTAFLRLLYEEDKASAILHAIPRLSPARFDVSTHVLAAVPGSPFAYWVSQELRALFGSTRPVDADERAVKQGLASADDFRFVRTHWEVLCLRVGEHWRVFAKGGRRSAFYADIPTVVNWYCSGAEIRANVNEKGVTRSNIRMLRSTEREYFFRPGVTWPLRGVRFSAQAVPKGAIFSNAGKMAFADSPSFLLGLFNSEPFNGLIGFFAGKVGGVQYEVGLIRRIPFPAASAAQANQLESLARHGWSARRELDTVNEVSHAFVMPAVLHVAGGSFDERVAIWAERVAVVCAELERVQSEIDELCFDLYGISDEDRRAIKEGFGVSNGRDDDSDAGEDSDEDVSDEDSDEDDEDSALQLDPEGLAAGLVSWAVGVAVGRFDVRLATGVRECPEDPDPFDPLPVCSPAMLTGDDGLPLDTPPVGYPVEVSPVLVDDPGHEWDLSTRVRAVFDVVFGDDADRWWRDVGAVLDARGGEVDNWLRKGFFDHHLKLHSKSRRKAPILWPLSTKSGSYRVWLYAHRVSQDSLFRVLTDVIEPKLTLEERRLADLVRECGPSPSASQRRTINTQEVFVSELWESRNEVAAVAPLWAPDLNDGVVIVLAPLWRLFAHHRPWSNELKSRWKKLAAGDYDWAQLAMHIWPERVVPKCAEDRSLAIAHKLEDVFWANDDENDKWHPRPNPTVSVDQLITERTSPTIHTARHHPQP